MINTNTQNTNNQATRANQQSDYFLATVYFPATGETVNCFVKKYFGEFVVITSYEDGDYNCYTWTLEKCKEHQLTAKRDSKGNQVKATQLDQETCHDRHIYTITQEAMDADW